MQERLNWVLMNWMKENAIVTSEYKQYMTRKYARLVRLRGVYRKNNSVGTVKRVSHC